MSRWYDKEVERLRTFNVKQLARFSDRKRLLEAQVKTAEASYRDQPWERTRKYIETRKDELALLGKFVDSRDPDMVRNYTDEIEGLCRCLAELGRAFEEVAPAEYMEFMQQHGNVRYLVERWK